MSRRLLKKHYLDFSNKYFNQQNHLINWANYLSEFHKSKVRDVGFQMTCQLSSYDFCLRFYGRIKSPCFEGRRGAIFRPGGGKKRARNHMHIYAFPAVYMGLGTQQYGFRWFRT